MRFQGASVLVTGGLGFVGARVTRALAAEGAQVIVLDNGFNGTPESVAGTPLITVEGSVTDPDLVNDLVRPVDLVFHMAARSIIRSAADPRADVDTNFGGTLNVLLALKNRPPGACRLVYTSSASVYGNAEVLPTPEDARYSPHSIYAASKLAGEHFCEAFRAMYGVECATVRYSNVYGPGQTDRNPYCGVIGKFIERALAGRPIQIHGDGEQTRDFTYLDDAVEATLLAALVPGAIGEVCNVGTGVEYSLNAVAAMVLQATGATVPVEHVAKREIDNIARRAVDPAKARAVLGWSPQVALPEGIRRTVAAVRGAEAQGAGA